MAWYVVRGVALMIAWLALSMVTTESLRSTANERIAGGVGAERLDAETLDRVRDRAEAVTIPLLARGCRHTIGGNAVLVDGGLLTNRHLVEEAESITVGATVLQPWLATLESDAGEGSLDLARLETTETHGVSGWGEANATLAGSDPPTGEPVVVAAWIDGSFSAMPARIHAYTIGSPYGDGLVMLLEPATVPGFSGGPVLDRDGDIVGILRAADSATSLAVAVPASAVRQWQRTAKQQVGGPSCRS